LLHVPEAAFFHLKKENKLTESRACEHEITMNAPLDLKMRDIIFFFCGQTT
jgi:hypothetical protein